MLLRNCKRLQAIYQIILFQRYKKISPLHSLSMNVYLTFYRILKCFVVSYIYIIFSTPSFSHIFLLPFPEWANIISCENDLCITVFRIRYGILCNKSDFVSLIKYSFLNKEKCRHYGQTSYKTEAVTCELLSRKKIFR